MFLSLLNVGSVRTVRADQLLGKLVALVKAFSSYFNAVLKIIEFILEYLKRLSCSIIQN